LPLVTLELSDSRLFYHLNRRNVYVLILGHATSTAKFGKIPPVVSFLVSILALFGATADLRGDAIIRSSEGLTAACRDNLRNRAFELEGTVIIPATVPRGSFTLLLDRQLVVLTDMHTNLTQGVSYGDRVIASGRTEPYRSGLKTTANCLALCRLESGERPYAPLVTIQDFITGDRHRTPLVSLRGVLQDVFPDDLDSTFICGILKDGPNAVNLICHCPRSWLAGFRSLLGCDVIVTGVAANNVRKSPRHLDPRLDVAGTNAFHVVSRPVGYPFNAPALPANCPADPRFIATLGPRTLRGTVLVSWGGESFLFKTPDGKVVRADLIEGPLPRAQTPIEAVGVVETDLCDLTLSRASWRPTAPLGVRCDKPKDTSLRDLFTNGRIHYPSLNVAAHGKALTVRGTVKNVAQGEDGTRKLLLADGNHTILVLCGHEARGNPPPEEDWRIAVTGICVKDSDVWRQTVPIPKIRGLFLVPRTDGDLVVLRKSPLWTPARFALVLAGLMAFLVAVLIWNTSLRVLVARRSHQVIKEQERKIESELRIRERTRLAADLHDNTVQNLTAIAYRITAAQGALDDRDSEAGRILQVAAKMLKSCRTALRQCLWDLRNDALSEPNFEIAILKTVETVAGDTKLSVRFAGQRNLVNDSTAHAVLNILRELVSNATIHGNATSVSIAGEARPGIIRFSVRDNGTGFDPAHRLGQDDGHFGLDGILERLDSLGGTLEIESSKGKGTYARVVIQSKQLPQGRDRT